MPPVINPNYGMVDFDIDVQAALSTFFRRVFDSCPLSELISGEAHPGFDEVPESSPDEVWKKWIRDNCMLQSPIPGV